ncbi:MAG: stage III sporulation protein AA [Clostridia bacterium]|nr:stage III sporulation protein AA [Clostridia bacterium]
MLIINNLQEMSGRQLFNYIPAAVRRLLYGISIQELEEIRLRQGLPVRLHFSDGGYYITQKGQLVQNPQNAVKVSKRDMDEALELITKSSVYASEHEIKNGYITVQGGHRVGICGRTVITDGRVSFIKDISGLNYRFAHEVKGASDKLIPYIYHDGCVENTLVISPPQCGKTTLLRDIARRLSQYGNKVSIVDERGEIAGMYGGLSSYELGANTDVLDFCPKDEGMLMMLRSMSPDIIITDEIGTQKEIAALGKLINSGVKIITSVHAENRGQLQNRQDLARLCAFFGCFITLSRREGAGTVEEVYTRQ